MKYAKKDEALARPPQTYSPDNWSILDHAETMQVHAEKWLSKKRNSVWV